MDIYYGLLLVVVIVASEGARQRSSRFSANEGLLNADSIRAGHLRSDHLTANRVRADHILSDYVSAGTLVVSKKRKSRVFKSGYPESLNDPSKEKREKVSPPDFSQSKYEQSHHRVNEPDGTSRRDTGISNSNNDGLVKSKRVSKERKSRISTSGYSENVDGSKPKMSSSEYPQIQLAQTNQGGRGRDEKFSYDREVEITSSNNDGLLKANTITANNIDTMSLMADQVSADRIKSESIKTSYLNVKSQSESKMDFYTHNTNSPDISQQTTKRVTANHYSSKPSSTKELVKTMGNQMAGFEDNQFVKRKKSRLDPNTLSIYSSDRERDNNWGKESFPPSRIRISSRDKPSTTDIQYKTSNAFVSPKLQMFMETPIQARRLPKFNDLKVNKKIWNPGFDEVLPTVDHLRYINDKYKSYRKINNDYFLFS